ncbi:hypothetical protein LTR36_005346 [Oleoguttula mirabilis]|uniref:Transposase n=1 Tax=Oleoguttula mirabilis TaxID=1507867 RepID=A0AAV9JF79_9PEZI|nr:hypothetical protein LTR36_005346 [Oleoguttula mirabilis]
MHPVALILLLDNCPLPSNTTFGRRLTFELANIYASGYTCTPNITFPEVFMQVFDITSDIVWEARRAIWPYIRKDSGWHPLYKVGKFEAGQTVLLYEMPMKPTNDWYLAEVERALYMSKDFSFFRTQEINYKLRQKLINLWVKKEIIAMRRSDNLQQRATENEIPYEVYGVDLQPDQPADRTSRSPIKKGKRARIFGQCKVAITLWNGDVESVWASALCGGRKDASAADAGYEPLQKMVDVLVEGEKCHIGARRGTGHDGDSTGASLEVVVREGDPPVDDE